MYFNNHIEILAFIYELAFTTEMWINQLAELQLPYGVRSCSFHYAKSRIIWFSCCQSIWLWFYHPLTLFRLINNAISFSYFHSACTVSLTSNMGYSKEDEKWNSLVRAPNAFWAARQWSKFNKPFPFCMHSYIQQESRLSETPHHTGIFMYK